MSVVGVHGKSLENLVMCELCNTIRFSKYCHTGQKVKQLPTKCLALGDLVGIWWACGGHLVGIWWAFGGHLFHFWT